MQRAQNTQWIVMCSFQHAHICIKHKCEEVFKNPLFEYKV